MGTSEDKRKAHGTRRAGSRGDDDDDPVQPIDLEDFRLRTHELNCATPLEVSVDYFVRALMVIQELESVRESRRFFRYDLVEKIVARAVALSQTPLNSHSREATVLRAELDILVEEYLAHQRTFVERRKAGA